MIIYIKILKTSIKTLALPGEAVRQEACVYKNKPIG